MSKGVSLSSVISTLKACVISNPDGVDENHLNVEYRQLMGTGIPFRDLGYSSIQDLIKDSDSLSIVSKQGRRLIVVNDTKAEHVSSLISKQKKSSSSKRKKTKFHIPRLQPLPPRNGYFRGGAKRGSGGRGGSSSISRISYNGQTITRHVSFAAPAGASSSSGGSVSPPDYVSTPFHQSPVNRSPINKSPPNQSPVNKSPVHQLQFNPTPINNHPTTKPVAQPQKFVSETPVSPIRMTPLTPAPTVTHNVINSGSLANGGNALPVTNRETTSNKAQQRIISASHTMPPQVPVAARNSSKKGNRLSTIKDDSVPEEGSFSDSFLKLIRKHGWPDPEYRYLPRTFENVTLYACMVEGSYSINNNDVPKPFHYSTIPDEYRDRLMSKEKVSEKAYNDMLRILKQASDYVPVSSNLDTIIHRVYEIVLVHTNGLWAYKVESDYKAKYNESLPHEWYNSVTSTGLLISEKLADISYVIRPAPQNLDGTVVISEEGDISLALPELIFPQAETWDIFVTKVVCSVEVWFRFVGQDYSDMCANMLELMGDHYKDWSRLVAPSLEIGGLYAYPGPQVTARVELLSFESELTALVRHIDHGDIEKVPKSHLCVLDLNFRHLPAQAVQCRLKDLEHKADDRLATAHLIDKLEGQVLVAERFEGDTYIDIVVYDTSGDEPVNLNHLVLTSLDYKILHPPTLPETNGVTEVTVCCIRDSGEIFLQVPGEGLHYLNDKLVELGDVFPEFFVKQTDELVLMQELYIIQSGTLWRRVVIITLEPISYPLVDVLFIDTGELKSISFTQLVPLVSMSPVLCEIPHQAISVKLRNIDTQQERVVKRLYELVPPPCQAIAKVFLEDSEPSVELFVREPMRNALLSVNDTLIILEDSLNSTIIQLEKISLQPKVSEDYFTINPIPIPQCGEPFDVYVISVSNPSNFVVIPLKYVNKMSELQANMTFFYNSLPADSHKLKRFQIGQACAVMHSDDYWYRGIIEQVVDRSMTQLMIRFCDFGNLAMISSDKLRVLKKEFFALPGLGLNASISDICPIFKDWSLEDCERAQTLLLERSLVSIIKDIKEEDGQKSLSLQLFDTLTSEDRDVGLQLVEESRAKFIRT